MGCLRPLLAEPEVLDRTLVHVARSSMESHDSPHAMRRRAKIHKTGWILLWSMPLHYLLGVDLKPYSAGKGIGAIALNPVVLFLISSSLRISLQPLNYGQRPHDPPEVQQFIFAARTPPFPLTASFSLTMSSFTGRGAAVPAGRATAPCPGVSEAQRARE